MTIYRNAPSLHHVRERCTNLREFRGTNSALILECSLVTEPKLILSSLVEISSSCDDDHNELSFLLRLVPDPIQPSRRICKDSVGGHRYRHLPSFPNQPATTECGGSHGASGNYHLSCCGCIRVKPMNLLHRRTAVSHHIV